MNISFARSCPPSAVCTGFKPVLPSLSLGQHRPLFSALDSSQSRQGMAGPLCPTAITSPAPQMARPSFKNRAMLRGQDGDLGLNTHANTDLLCDFGHIILLSELQFSFLTLPEHSCENQ